MDESEKTLELQKVEHVISLFGNFDENVRIIEESLNVRIISGERGIRITGDPGDVEKAYAVLEKLASIIEQGEELTKQKVRYLADLAAEGSIERITDYSDDHICVTARGRHIRSKTHGQRKYVRAIRDNTVVFGIGPAGTGKTFLAVAMAVNAFKDKQVSRIVLTRPAVEAGEKLGFLPGDMQNKVDPYLRPLYDALHEIMGAESYHKYLEKGMIEVAPLAYMRGRTLDDSFIILDEAQNTTPEQMKMFLTRIGFGSKAVVTGDITQIDLPRDKKSGLKEVIKILEDVEGIGFVWLTEKDVVRHELVQRIIKAYDEYDQKMG
ncbi:MAG: phosphate starvation-inducible protein PhoH [Clostridiaceae bacterium]|nr:phosphate starvation-inducible protein PhoH [Clostridiaceae bacterium]